MSGPTFTEHRYLRAWRKYLGLTQEHVANKLDIGGNTLSGWESGKRTVDLDDLHRLAEVYGVEPALLLYAPPGSAKLKALHELSDAIETMDPDAVADLIKMAKRLSSPKAD